MLESSFALLREIGILTVNEQEEVHPRSENPTRSAARCAWNSFHRVLKRYGVGEKMLVPKSKEELS